MKINIEKLIAFDTKIIKQAETIFTKFEKANTKLEKAYEVYLKKTTSKKTTLSKTAIKAWEKYKKAFYNYHYYFHHLAPSYADLIIDMSYFYMYYKHRNYYNSDSIERYLYDLCADFERFQWDDTANNSFYEHYEKVLQIWFNAGKNAYIIYPTYTGLLEKHSEEDHRQDHKPSVKPLYIQRAKLLKELKLRDLMWKIKYVREVNIKRECGVPLEISFDRAFCFLSNDSNDLKEEE